MKRICNETKALEAYKDDRRPVFKSSPSQFMTVIYSVDYNITGKDTGNVTGNVKRLLLVIDNDTITREEIMHRLGLKGSGNFREAYLYPAIEQGFVSKLYPESDKRRDQAYYLTEKGKKLIEK